MHFGSLVSQILFLDPDLIGVDSHFSHARTFGLVSFWDPRNASCRRPDMIGISLTLHRLQRVGLSLFTLLP